MINGEELLFFLLGVVIGVIGSVLTAAVLAVVTG